MKAYLSPEDQKDYKKNYMGELFFLQDKDLVGRMRDWEILGYIEVKDWGQDFDALPPQ